jgi:hypothetical protein
MFAARNADRIAFIDADASVALGRPAGRRSPRRLGAALALLALALAALAALVAGATPALAAEPCGTSGVLSGSAADGVRCTYTTQGTEDTFTVPAGVTSVSVTAVGAPGGTGRIDVSDPRSGSGGLGAKVSNAALPVTPGATLWVDVGALGADGVCPVSGAPGGSFDGGTGGSCAGSGGGSSALLTAARATATLTGDVASDSRLLVAGGGGGGSQLSGGGSAGNPAVTGAGAGACGSNGGAGGVGPTDGTGGGPGGCPGHPIIAGATGTAAMGGGGTVFSFGGGGGGGGWFGGGGGGGGVRGDSGNGGGGGGGSSYAGAGPSDGITITTAHSSQAPEVTVTAYYAPAAASDAYATDEDAPLAVTAPGVLGNDSDPNGDALTAELVSGTAHGSLTLNPDGSFSYTPDPDFNGSDSFTYRVSDGNLDSDPATVTIEVRPVDDPSPPADPTQPPPAGAAGAPGGPSEPAITQLRLGARCVRPSRSGRVRIRMSLRMAQPRPLQIRIDRAVGGGVWQSCPSPNPQRRFTGRFERVATLSQLPGRRAAAAASVARRLTLKLKLSPGLYRISVRAKLDHNRLSRPARRYLRVLG